MSLLNVKVGGHVLSFDQFGRGAKLVAELLCMVQVDQNKSSRTVFQITLDGTE